MTEKKPKENNPELKWLYILCIAATLFVAFLFFLSTWQHAIKQDYMGKLTPEERQEIADQKEAEELRQQEAAEENAKAINDLLFAKIPLIYVIIVAAGTWWISTSRRHW